MMLQLDIQSQTAQRLKKILAFYPDEESFAQNVIAYQIAELKRANMNLQLDLHAYEAKHQMKSPAFYEKFSQGNLGDQEDFMLWAGLYELLLENESRLQELS